MAKLDHTSEDIITLAQTIGTKLQQISPDAHMPLFTLVAMIPDGEGNYTTRVVGSDISQSYMTSMNGAIRDYTREMQGRREQQVLNKNNEAGQKQ
jgi:hypothetical protein